MQIFIAIISIGVGTVLTFPSMDDFENDIADRIDDAIDSGTGDDDTVNDAITVAKKVAKTAAASAVIGNMIKKTIQAYNDLQQMKNRNQKAEQQSFENELPSVREGLAVMGPALPMPVHPPSVLPARPPPPAIHDNETDEDS